MKIPTTRKTYTDAEIEAKFEANQKDLMLVNVRVQWMGAQVRLFTVNNPHAVGLITANERACFKIKLWCVKNNCRCTAIKDGRIWL